MTARIDLRARRGACLAPDFGDFTHSLRRVSKVYRWYAELRKRAHRNRANREKTQHRAGLSSQDLQASANNACTS